MAACTDICKKGQNEGKQMASDWAAAAAKTDHPIQTLRDDLSALNVSHQQHLAALKADGAGFDKAAEEALKYHTATVGLKQAIKDKAADRIKSGMETLQKASHKLAEEIYKASAQQPGAGPQPEAGPQTETVNPGAHEKKEGPAAGKDDIIDADFKASSDK